MEIREIHWIPINGFCVVTYANEVLRAASEHFLHKGTFYFRTFVEHQQKTETNACTQL